MLPRDVLMLVGRASICCFAVSGLASGMAGCHVNSNGIGGDGTDASGGSAGHAGPIPDASSDGSTEPCAGLPVPAIACAQGRTLAVCRSVMGEGLQMYRWVITCPDQEMDAAHVDADAGAGDGATPRDSGTPGDAKKNDAGVTDSGGPKTCLSSTDCGAGQICTTEDGTCIPWSPPCASPAGCSAVCSGTCRPRDGGPVCGHTTCGAGMHCCNQSCGICTLPGGLCTTQVCDQSSCTKDEDCHLVDDYCTGCDCRALTQSASLPACSGPGVQCFVAPCLGRTARCVNQRCTVAASL
jgi:hypothetical protein